MTEFKKEVATTERFSDRVADYVKFRPRYPDEVFTHLQKATPLDEFSHVADIGSGTGISTGPLLKRAGHVYAVEPNAAMRRAAELEFDGQKGFHSIDGTAEKTGLAENSLDLILAAQAFHWFSPQPTALEWRRILKPGGRVALLWNERKETGSAFLEGYEKLLQDFGTDYCTVKHQNLKANGAIRDFFGAGGYQETTFHNTQRFDYDGLKGRLLSSSYAPNAGHPQHPPMLKALKALFDRSQKQGEVEVVYETKLYFGSLPPR